MKGRTVRRRAAQSTVRLVGVAGRYQGSHDALCAYYAAATLLCALRPEIEDAFDAPTTREDPLFSNVRRRRGESLERLAAGWLADGMELHRVAAAMNRACEGGPVTTHFVHRSVARSARAFDELCAAVDAGCPSLLGWDSREIGSHTVVVVGYERHAGSRNRWLRVLDPVRIQEALEWGQLRALATGPLELVVCTRHEGVRPDRLTTHRDARRRLIPDRTRIDRFDPATGRHVPLLDAGTARGAPLP